MISRSIATLDGQRISIDIRAMAGTESEFEEAELRMDGLREAGHAVSARYDRRSARVVVMLTTGVQLAFPARLVEGLAGATAESLGEIEISPSGGGLGLHWPLLDADVYLPALLQGGVWFRERDGAGAWGEWWECAAG